MGYLPRLSAAYKSAPYQESTYLNERIAQWRQQDPPIKHDDEDAIIDAYDGDGETDLSKDDVRRLLGCIDATRVRDGKRPRFRRRYNEKWLTIRCMLTGFKSRGAYADDELVSVIRARFGEILMAFKARVKGKGRYAMINYSFLFRRIFDLYGLNWYSIDFPPLKTPEKRRKNVQLWVECCRDTGYPYINTDSVVFPAVNFYQPVPWLTIYDGLTTAGQRAARGGREYQFGRGRKRSRAAADRRFDKSVKRWIQRYIDAEGAHPGARCSKL